MRAARRLLVAVFAGLLIVPSAALAVGFGPTTPLAGSAPAPPSGPVSATPSGNHLTVTRVTPAYYTVDVPTPTGNVGTNLHVAWNAAGDALVTWTENGGNNHFAAALFWPANATQPNDAHQLLSGAETATTPYGVLDPAGSATVVWPQGNTLWQVTTANAGAADPWGAPTSDLGAGGGFGASLPDGRAVFGFLRGVPFGNGTAFQAWATTRVAGHPYRPPALLQDVGSGPGARFASSIFPATVVGISPAGRALVGYITTLNGDNGQCDPYDRQVVAALTTVSDGTDAPAFTQQVVSDHADAADPSMLFMDATKNKGVATGSDDRLALTWREAYTGCFLDQNRPVRYRAAYTAPGQAGMTPTGVGIPESTQQAPRTFKGFWWRADGQLLFWTQTSGPITNYQTLFDTGVPVQSGGGDPGGGDPGGGNPGGGNPGGGDPGGGNPGGGDPGGGKPPVIKVIPTKFKASSNGTVKMTVTAPSPGDLLIDLIVKRSGLVKKAAAKTAKVGHFKRHVTKAGKVTLTLKLQSKAARKTLKRKHKLKVTVVTTFKPAGGGKPIKTSKPVTFKLKKR